MKHLWLVCLLCILLTGCAKFDSGVFWIRENTPTESNAIAENSVPIPTQTEKLSPIPQSLQMDVTVTIDDDLCFRADVEAFCNDLGYYLQRQLPQELWLPAKDNSAPYSRAPARSQRLDMEPVLKNEPMIEVYLSSEDRLSEASAILLTHDWTDAGETGFLQLGTALLQCFWPDCPKDVITQTVGEIRKDINQNVYPDNSAVPRPIKVYVYGTAAAYGYTHAARISINVIPVDANRLQELTNAGVEIIEIT